LANKYLSASLGTRQWADTTGTWVTSNGGTTPTTPPAGSDTAFLTSLSGAVTVNTAGCITAIINCTGYTNTLTINSSCKLLCYASIIFPATMTLVNNGNLTWGDGASVGDINSAIDIPGNFTFGGSGNSTRTISANLTLLGAVTMTGQQKVNGAFNIYIKNGFEGNGNIFDGTCSIYLQGGQLGARFANSNVYLDGTLTTRAQASATFGYFGFGWVSACTVTWLSGTLTNTNTFTVFSGLTSFNIGSNVVFYRVKFNENTAYTYTLLADLYVTDILTEYLSANIAITIDGAFNIKVAGNLRSYTASTYYSTYFKGTATFEMVGTGTLGLAQNYAGSGSVKAITYVENNIIINTAGTITFGNIGISGSNTLTYTAGTIAGTGEIYIVGTASLTGTVTYPNVTIGFLNKGESSYFTGPFVLNVLTDMTFTNLYINYNSTMNITDTKTLTIPTTFHSRGNYLANNVIASSGTGTITFNGAKGSLDLVKTDFTNISATNRLITYGGTITTSTLVNSVDVTDLSSPRNTVLVV